MRQEIIFAGFGGQGIVKVAHLAANAAGLYEGKEVVQTQSYGIEARGGACRAEVIISDEEIDYIKTVRIQCIVVMSQPALEKYFDRIQLLETIVLVDSTLVQNVPETIRNVYRVPASHISEIEFKRTLFANIIMLGALSSITEIISIEAIRHSIRENVPEKTIEQNFIALQKGYNLGKALILDLPLPKRVNALNSQIV